MSPLLLSSLESSSDDSLFLSFSCPGSAVPHKAHFSFTHAKRICSLGTEK